MKIPGSILRTGILLLAGAALAGCEPPTAESTQNGYRGTGMLQLQLPSTKAELEAANVAPEAATPPLPQTPPYARDIYENVEVLGDLSVGNFNRLMAAMTAWVAPDEGCTYCHEAGNFAAEGMYTKTVSRRMLQMTQHINENWSDHVAQTGVTCYTCHRGMNVPQYIWFEDPGPKRAAQFAGWTNDSNVAGLEKTAYSSLPYDAFEELLVDDAQIRVLPTQALPSDYVASIHDTENTYSLMMHMSDGLGVNCTFCHNTRAMGSWEQSTPQRVTAWYGIRMSRDLNVDWLNPLQGVYPDNRLGVTGDAPKANCATCHQGVNKPLYGAPMAKDYPSLQSTSTDGAPLFQAPMALQHAEAASELVVASDD